MAMKIMVMMIGADGDGCDWGANGVWDFVVSDLVA